MYNEASWPFDFGSQAETQCSKNLQPKKKDAQVWH